VSRSSPPAAQQIWLEPLHPGQARAYRALIGHRFMALRCGRRFGKTALAKSWASQGLLQGEEVGFAPEHKHMAEVYADLKATLAPLLVARDATGSELSSIEAPRCTSATDPTNTIAASGRAARRGDDMDRIWEEGNLRSRLALGVMGRPCAGMASASPDLRRGGGRGTRRWRPARRCGPQ
jgi:hypothetical protein